jgi:hypothetical protein
MDDLTTLLERAAQRFRPTADLIDGTLRLVDRRRTTRRVTSATTAALLFVLSFGAVWIAFRPSGSVVTAGVPACGRSWSSVVAGEDGGLFGVDATTSGMVVAVGPGEDAAPGTRPLATRLHRGQWGSIPPIVPGGGDGTTAYFGDVAVVSPDDVWAVGASWTSQGGPAAAQVLVEHYDGRRWTIVEAPNPGAAETRLEAVAASGPDDVWAVGSTVDGTIARAIAQHWDGSSWSLVPVPDATGGGSGSSLSAVEALAPDDAWAVGSGAAGVLVTHWDGVAWSIVDVPHTEHARLADVEALAPDDVWAVGWSSTGTMANRPTPPVVLHFDGTAWESHELPVPDDMFVAPFAVTAPAANDVWIVGWQGGSNLGEHYGRLTPFVAHWDGAGWSLVDVGVEDPPAVLFGATADTDGSLWFVGRQGGGYDEDAIFRGGRALVVEGTCR